MDSIEPGPTEDVVPGSMPEISAQVPEAQSMGLSNSNSLSPSPEVPSQGRSHVPQGNTGSSFGESNRGSSLTAQPPPAPQRYPIAIAQEQPQLQPPVYQSARIQQPVPTVVGVEGKHYFPPTSQTYFGNTVAVPTQSHDAHQSQPSSQTYPNYVPEPSPPQYSAAFGSHSPYHFASAPPGSSNYSIPDSDLSTQATQPTHGARRWDVNSHHQQHYSMFTQPSPPSIRPAFPVPMHGVVNNGLSCEVPAQSVNNQVLPTSGGDNYVRSGSSNIRTGDDSGNENADRIGGDGDTMRSGCSFTLSENLQKDIGACLEDGRSPRHLMKRVEREIAEYSEKKKQEAKMAAEAQGNFRRKYEKGRLRARLSKAKKEWTDKGLRKVVNWLLRKPRSSTCSLCNQNLREISEILE